MLQSISCKNFQSLQDVEIEIGKFTVIVGASSSGKSAIIRAFRAIADNALNSDNIMQGTKHASVAIKTDTATVTIERSVGGSSVYKIARISSKESSFTKLNRQVPTQVTEVLGILPSTKEVASISFAGQHDAPYLLTDSSSNAARILGELTNVSTIFAAVREASKRVKAASTELNIRKKDQEQIMQHIVKYRDLKQQIANINEVEEIWSDVESIQDTALMLESCIDGAQTASDALQAHVKISEPPSMDEILESQKTLNEFKELLRLSILANKEISNLTDAIEASEIETTQLENQLHNLLTEAGQCPLCHQEVK